MLFESVEFVWITFFQSFHVGKQLRRSVLIQSKGNLLWGSDNYSGVTLFKSENKWQKIEQVPIPGPVHLLLKTDK